MLKSDLIIFCIWISLETLAFVTSVFGNILVIKVMSREERLKKKSSYFIISMAVADLLSCFFVGAVIVVRSFKIWDHSKEVSSTCLWLVTSLLALESISIVHLVLISVDRYFAVCRPIKYHTGSMRFVKHVITVCWVFGTILGAAHAYHFWNEEGKCAIHQHFLIYLSCLGFCATLTIAMLYSLIWKAFCRGVSLINRCLNHKDVIFTFRSENGQNRIKKSQLLILISTYVKFEHQKPCLLLLLHL